MVKKKAVKKPPAGKKTGSPSRKTARPVKKKLAKTVSGAGVLQQINKQPGTGKGAAPTKKVKAEKMTSEMKHNKDAATMIDELLPADGTGNGDQRKTEEKKKRKTKVKFKSVMLREEAISYFEAIVAGLKRGSIQIRQGEDAITLKPTPQLDVAVKAASKDQDESIVFEIGWRTSSDSELTISTE